MKSKTKSEGRLKKRLIVRWIGLSAAMLIVSTFLFSSSAMMHTIETVWKGNTKQQAELASPQAGRPDILWMRGGHAGSNINISRSANGQILATSGDESTVKIWRSSDDLLLRTINSASGNIGLSPDGTLIAIAAQEVKIFKVSDGNLLLTIPSVVSQNQRVGGVAISSDNQYIATVADNVNEGKMFRISNGSLVHDFGANGFGYGSVAFSADNQLIAMGHTSGNPKIFSVATGSLVRTGGDFGYLSLTFSPDGQYLAGASGVGPRVFRVSDGSVVGLASNASTPYGSTVAFSPDGQYLAGGVDGSTVKLWQISGSAIWTFLRQFQAEPTNAGNSATNVARVSFNATNQLITTQTSIKVWNPDNGSFIRNVSQFNGSIRSLAFTADGQNVAVAATNSAVNSLYLLNKISGSPVVNFPQSVGLGIYQMGLTADSQRLVTIDDSNNHHYVKIWNATDGSLIRNTDFSNNGSLSLAVSPDNQSYVISGYGNGVGGATQYSINDGTVIKVINSNNSCNEKTLTISPDGQTLATMRTTCSNGENGLTFYRMSDGAIIQRIGPNPVPAGSLRSGTFSPDGLTFAATVEYSPADDPKPVYLFRISDGARIRQFDGNQATADQVAFSPDGLAIASTGLDHTVRFWRVSDATLLQTYNNETIFKGSGGFVAFSPIKFSPDGSRFAYGRSDATVVMAANPLNSISVSISSSLSSHKNTTLTVPINVEDTSNKEIISYDFHVTYDPNVFTPETTVFDKTGTLSSSFEVNVNSSTPGTLIVSGYGSNALSGSGTLLNLKFNTIGDVPSCSALNFTAFQFNEGNPPSATSNGQACATAGTISGAVVYGLSTTAVSVPNVTITAAGTPSVNTTTAANGSYTLTGLGAGAYTVTPSKTGEVNDAVSALDASLVAQHVIELTTLNASKQTAADVSGNGTITSFDAGLIARFSVDLPDTEQAGVWKFTPVNRTYPNLETDQTNQNYTAILMGDVTGNWTPIQQQQQKFFADEAAELDEGNSIQVGFGKTKSAPGGELIVPVVVSNLSSKGIYSFEFEFEFDADVLSLEQTADVTQLLKVDETISHQFSFAVNPLEKGKVKVSAYGVTALEGEGILLSLKFTSISKGSVGSELKWTRFRFNEGEQKIQLKDGLIKIGKKPETRFRLTREVSDERQEN